MDDRTCYYRDLKCLVVYLQPADKCDGPVRSRQTIPSASGGEKVVSYLFSRLHNYPHAGGTRPLATLTRDGLLGASFILPQGQRDRRELTRYRTELVQERSREVNRVQGVLERANIKLAAVAMEIMGVSGRAILAALIAGRAALAKGRMRTEIPRLEQALTGLRREHPRRLLALQLAHINFLDTQIDALSAEITHCLRELEADAPLAPPAVSACTAGGAEMP
jgi:hypothetical protein